MTVRAVAPTRSGGNIEAVAEASPLVPLSTPTSWVMMLAFSAVLGVVLTWSPMIATAHQVLVLSAVVGLASFSRRPELILAITVHAGFSDVLWRLSRTRGPHEGSKYALIAGFALFTVRYVRRPSHLWLSAAIAFMLLPGAAMGAAELGASGAREYISANLAGLIAILAAVLACSSVRMSPAEMRGLILAGVSPIVAVTSAASIGTATSEVVFKNQSNFTTSAGFGPNQVSSLLCVGALMCILLMLQKSLSTRHRLILGATTVWFVGQAILTFSRGGLYSLAMAAAAMFIAGLTISGQRARVIVMSGVFVLTGVQLLSWAGAFTDGVSEERLSSLDNSGRSDIAAADISLFADNPLLGVGVGMSPIRRNYRIPAAPHTEFTRLPAEHGMLGVLVVGALALLTFRLLRAADGWHRIAASGLLVMAIAQMTHSATRIGSIAICYGLAAIRSDSS